MFFDSWPGPFLGCCGTPNVKQPRPPLLRWRLSLPGRGFDMSIRRLNKKPTRPLLAWRRVYFRQLKQLAEIDAIFSEMYRLDEHTRVVLTAAQFLRLSRVRLQGVIARLLFESLHPSATASLATLPAGVVSAPRPQKSRGSAPATASCPDGLALPNGKRN